MPAILKEGIQFLERRGVPEPEISAEQLLQDVLKKTRTQIYSEPGKKAGNSERDSFFALLKKRAERFPLQYLTGTVSFRGHELQVGEGCLIPRPETELLVEAILNRMGRASEPLHLLDIGTGSGNIAVSLAVERPHWQLAATDSSKEALAYARRNAEANGVSNRISFIHCDLFTGASKFDALISNPPYLSSRDFLNLQKEVTFEPHMALDGGEDGLLFYRRIISSAKKFLKKGNGMIFFELGIKQAKSVSAELQANGFSEIEMLKDYSGIDRIISGCFK